METENNHEHNPAHRPQRPGLTPQSGQPVTRRPVLDGFAPRRPITPTPAPTQRPAAARPIPVTSRPAAAPAPLLRPQAPQPAVAHHPVKNDFTPHPTQAAPRAHTPSPQQREFVPEVTDDIDAPKGTKQPKERNNTGHSGLVGFIVFILLGALLVSPFVPGKILANFPLSSSNFSTGDQALACTATLSNVSASTTYNSKAGTPLNYRNSTSTTETGVCNGQTQTAVTGHTSQFSPLALLIDVAVALVVAIVVAKLWRRIFGEKRERR